MKEPNSSAEMIPKSSEAGSTCDGSTKLEIAGCTREPRAVGPANWTSAILGS